MRLVESGDRKNNKHKQLIGTVPGMGGGSNLFMCYPFLRGKWKRINKIPRKSQEYGGTVPGQSLDNPGTIYVFAL